MEIVFLVIVLVMAGVILWLNKGRNAWDIMFFNTTLAMVMLFMIGLLNSNFWREIVYTLGAVAVGSGIAGIFKYRKDKS